MGDVRELRKAFASLNDTAWEQLGTYFQMLVDWNEKVNLTAITDETEVYVKHFFDSLLIASSSESESVLASSHRICDIGTGAGFPGLVLAIAAPGKHFVLVDALAKRLKFLQSVVDALALKNVDLVHARAEDFSRQKQYRESFDLVVSRAVAKLNVLCELTLPLVKVGGWFVSYKGPSVEDESAEATHAIGILGGREAFMQSCTLPLDMGTRTLVGIRKDRSTPKEYPRKAGTPQKAPL
ncbi:16S rRNA (guanine(527)-N(7))-methyltransferase RsmG [Alicyclobacillus ferrooxydans]|uniref:Ribosomal RNA small subunit methyltransferase G n=1 Tax=Alicyclobacillus ferrooxydans TaxID=471514 RepID=A0A0P9EU81_9BACL|nr:16S rRNA (guanine(527)-N(7))-methyltransferase RsmG [Alicyclobacillus ferrooxydans]KPV42504.1 hypothetical protein AN477_17285 [Alicyclobacillus ferrooxydans]